MLVEFVAITREHKNEIVMLFSCNNHKFSNKLIERAHLIMPSAKVHQMRTFAHRMTIYPS